MEWIASRSFDREPHQQALPPPTYLPCSLSRLARLSRVRTPGEEVGPLARERMLFVRKRTLYPGSLQPRHSLFLPFLCPLSHKRSLRHADSRARRGQRVYHVPRSCLSGLG